MVDLIIILSFFNLIHTIWISLFMIITNDSGHFLFLFLLYWHYYFLLKKCLVQHYLSSKHIRLSCSRQIQLANWIPKHFQHLRYLYCCFSIIKVINCLIIVILLFFFVYLNYLQFSFLSYICFLAINFLAQTLQITKLLIITRS